MSKLLQDKIGFLPPYARGAAVVHLIRECLEHPQIFVFGELLRLPNVQALAEAADSESWLRLLQVFAFGGYADYVSAAASLPPLSCGMRAKLRSLTLVSLAEKAKRLPYDLLLRELQLTNRRELEDLIIDVIYAKALVGKMDQKQDCLEVESTVGRDIKEEQLDSISSVLTSWCENCDNVLSSIETQVAVANSLKAETVARKQELEAQIAKTRASVKAAASEFDEESVLATPPGHKNDNFLDRMRKGPRMRRPKPSYASSQSDFFK